MPLYLIRSADGNEIGPVGLDQLKGYVKDGRLKPSHMIFVQEQSRWYLATALPEVRELLRQQYPNLNKNRAAEPKSLTDSRRNKKLSASDVKKPSASDVSTPKKVNPRRPGSSVHEFYTVRTGDGVEHQNLTLLEVKDLVQKGHVKATTMVLTRTSNRWHLAASILEIRRLLRKYNPGQNSILDRIRNMRVHSRDRASNMGVDPDFTMIKVKKPFWKKLFGGKE
jgi:hypothetical protein